jgi:toxin ParE1/3/4
MHDIIISPAAEADIEDIADYTLSAWGFDQTNGYIGQIRRDIESLVQFPKRFPIYVGQAGTFHKMTSGGHLVFFIVQENSVTIVRVLHERMDVDGQFDGLL